jgi:uncharacterized protein YpmS
MNTVMVVITVINLGVSTEYSMPSSGMDTCTTNKEYIIHTIKSQLNDKGVKPDIKYKCVINKGK